MKPFQPNSATLRLLSRLTAVLPSLLGLGLFGLSLWTLRQELQHYTFAQVWQTLTAIPRLQLGLSLALTCLKESCKNNLSVAQKVSHWFYQCDLTSFERSRSSGAQVK
ncbi:MAG: hypothetical protein ACKO7W_20055 [Elainella sp.]